MDSDPGNSETFKKPAVVNWLIPLFVIGGFVWLYYFAWLFMVAQIHESGYSLVNMVGFPLPMRILSVLIITAIPWGAGIGVALGRKWGWWLGGFFFLSCFFESVFMGTIVVLDLSEKVPVFWDFCSRLKYLEQESMSQRLGTALQGHGLRMVVFLGLYAYWFSPRIRKYFGAALVRPWWAILIGSACCLGYFGVYISVFSK